MPSTMNWADKVSAGASEDGGVLSALDRGSRMAIVNTVRMVGGAMVTILLVAVVLNEVFNAIDVGSGPFSQIGTDLQTTGVAAMSLLIVGLIVVAANRLMNIFGGARGGM
jgi:hypothetical protein